MDGFWIGIALAIGVVFLFTWLGAVITRGAPGDADGPRRRDDRPFMPGPDGDGPLH